MNYSLSADNDRLHNEVVISNAPSRTDKHGKEQFHVDIDELVFLAAASAATDQGNPFVITRFNQEFQSQLRRTGLMRLSHPMYEDKIRRTLDRFTTRNGAQYRLTGLAPYILINYLKF